MDRSTSQKQIAIYALTERGGVLAGDIARKMGGELHMPQRLTAAFPGAAVFESLSEHVAATFHNFSAHIFIAATGVVVRVIAPWLQGKDKDPAVLVLDQEGRFCISLLSGHIGGANDLARQVALITGGQSVITTATDTAGAPAIDCMAMDAGLAIGDTGRIKYVNAALAAAKSVAVYDPGNWLGIATHDKWFNPVTSAADAAVMVGWQLPTPDSKTLALHPKCLCLGVGCRRGAPASDILEAIAIVLQDMGAARQSLAGMASVEAKRDEQGLLEAAREMELPLVFYPAATLDGVDVPTPSERVARAVGTHSVCEAAALLLAEGGGLLVAKRAFGNVTLAVAQRTK